MPPLKLPETGNVFGDVTIERLVNTKSTSMTEYSYVENDKVLFTKSTVDKRVQLWANYCSDAFMQPRAGIQRDVLYDVQRASSYVFYAKVNLENLQEKGRGGKIEFKTRTPDAGFMLISFPESAAYPVLTYVCASSTFRTPLLKLGSILLSYYESIVKATVGAPVDIEIDAINLAKTRTWYLKQGYAYVDATPPPPVSKEALERTQGGGEMKEEISTTVKMKKTIE